MPVGSISALANLVLVLNIEENADWNLGPHGCHEMVLEQISWRSGYVGCI